MSQKDSLSDAGEKLDDAVDAVTDIVDAMAVLSPITPGRNDEGELHTDDIEVELHTSRFLLKAVFR